ncbi:hypothetical protein ABPG77_005569 [Micractinium sp. CCAP 211/92]
MERLFAGALFAYEDQEEEPSELRGIIAYSGSGKLFVAGDDGTIKAADVRQQLLSGTWAQGGPASGGKLAQPAVRTITTSPPLELTAAHFCLNRSGTYAAVAGCALEDPEISRIVVVDLTNCRPAPALFAGGGGSSGAAPASPAGRHDICEAVVLDSELFGSRPGLRVLQVAWHPDSDAHLAVLTSDNTWRLYNTQHADLAEQTFELQLHSRRGLGLGASSSDGSGRAVAAFAFGPPEQWQRFSVYFLTADGSLWSLCPVVPFGCRYPGSAVEQLAAVGDAEVSPNDEAWLQRAFSQLSTPQHLDFAPGMVQSVPHALDEHVPALAGPLRVVSAGQPPGEQASQLVQMAGGSDAAQALLLTRYAEGCSVLAAATARGLVGLHLVAGAASPSWHEAAPQCICEGVEIRAVRSQVGASPAAAGGEQAQQLLLLDIVDLSLPPESGAAATSAGDPEDAEFGGGAAAAPASMLLAQDAVAPELLYSVHSSGAHAITLSWLPLLAGLLAEDGRLPAALPRPGAELLLRSSKGLVAAAPVGDALSGSALVVLEADGRPQCLRPQHAAAAEGGGAAAATAGPGPAAAGGGQAAAAQKDKESQLATIYGDLRKGPKTCTLPTAAAGKPAGAGNPEGQRLLTEAAAALRASHVEFAHQAHQDLLERIRQLQGELDKQRRRADAAEQVAALAEQASSALDAQAARVLQFQENLGERLRLLAELHWSLPRPPSQAEQRFAAEQLPAFEAAAAALEEDARALRARFAALQRKLRSVGEAAAGAAGGPVAVPPHQLRRVREALAEQEALIAANHQRLAVLEQAVAGAGAR